MRKEAMANKKLINEMKFEIQELKIQLSQANKVVECMSSVLTEGQIRKIMNPGAIQWTWNDISNAICLQSHVKGG